MSKPHDSVIKLMILGKRGVGKSSLMKEFSPGDLTKLPMPASSYGIEYTARTIDLTKNKPVKMQIWEPVIQERFRTIPKTFYQGANGILLVYDVTNQSSFTEISNWLHSIKEVDPDIKMVLVGNKAYKYESERDVSTARGEALANEYNIGFFETSAVINMNVEEAFFSIARDIMTMLE